MENNSCIRVFADETQIKECRKKLKVAENSFVKLGKVLKLAGNEVRLKILYLLEEESELCVCDLSDILGMTVPAVSQHLRKLKDGNLLQFSSLLFCQGNVHGQQNRGSGINSHRSGYLLQVNALKKYFHIL